MHLLIFTLLAGVSLALPPGYVVPKPSKLGPFSVSSIRHGSRIPGIKEYKMESDEMETEFLADNKRKLKNFPRVSGTVGFNSESSEEEFDNSTPCDNGELQNIDGSCARPIVTRNFFLYAAPPLEIPISSRAQVPQPRVNYNVVFISNPDLPEPLDPLVVPPPQQKTLVYVLRKIPEPLEQEVIEVPEFPAESPEVVFVNYVEGENPQLPIGIDLKTALNSINAQKAHVIDLEDSELDIKEVEDEEESEDKFSVERGHEQEISKRLNKERSHSEEEGEEEEGEEGEEDNFSPQRKLPGNAYGLSRTK